MFFYCQNYCWMSLIIQFNNLTLLYFLCFRLLRVLCSRLFFVSWYCSQDRESKHQTGAAFNSALPTLLLSNLSAAALGPRSKSRFFFYMPRVGDTPLSSRDAIPLDFSLHPKNKPAPATQATGRPLPSNDIGDWGIVFWWKGAVDTGYFFNVS